jgi:hypothetical protein
LAADRLRGKEANMPVSMESRENGRVVFIVLSDPWNTGDLRSRPANASISGHILRPIAVDLTGEGYSDRRLQQIFEDLRRFARQWKDPAGATRAMQFLRTCISALSPGTIGSGYPEQPGSC